MAVLHQTVCLLYLTNIYILKTDESGGFIKGLFFSFLSCNLANNPWVQTDH